MCKELRHLRRSNSFRPALGPVDHAHRVDASGNRSQTTFGLSRAMPHAAPPATVAWKSSQMHRPGRCCRSARRPWIRWPRAGPESLASLGESVAGQTEGVALSKALEPPRSLVPVVIGGMQTVTTRRVQARVRRCKASHTDAKRRHPVSGWGVGTNLLARQALWRERFLTVCPAPEGVHPARGVDPAGARPDHADMDAPDRPDELPLAHADLRRQQAWNELLLRMQELHAQLEYLRLMLRLNQNPS